MHIVEQRLLRGPNLYAGIPCLLTVIELQELGASSAALPGFAGRLLALLPSLERHPGPGGQPAGWGDHLRRGCGLAHVLRHVAMELQALAGAPGSYSRTRRERSHTGRYRIVCAYQLEAVAQDAFALALDLVAALSRGEDFDMDAPLAALRQQAERRAIGTSTGAVLEAARRRSIPCHRLSEEGNLFVLGWGAKQKTLQATITGDTGTIAVRIASDKQLTKTLLSEAGLPVPKGHTAASVEEAQSAARRLGGIVTIKPLDGNQGKGVTTMCQTPEEVAAAYDFSRQYSRRAIVERYVQGRDYRVLVTGDKVAAASCRLPPAVTGDGQRTVRALVEIENQNPARGEGHANILTRIPLDAAAEAIVRAQGLELDSVPEPGRYVTLRGNANLSTGGTAEDVTDLLPAETRDICIRAARKIGLDVAGIDIVCQDIAQPLREQGGAIIEVNAAPGIRMHQYPSRGQSRDAGGAIADAMFGGDQGRIPVIAVTGTNGKTTTSLLLGHTARLAGRRTGVTTTEGIYIDGQRITRGDCSGYWSARTVLGAPEVDFAVLETARGGILKRGLAFDRCDVSVVLNVSADHLGLDGIDTVRALSRVKAVVAKAASRAVVLNAEDSHCVAMAAQLDPGVEVLYFALSHDHPVLARHMEQGGRGAFLQDGMLVLCNGARRQELLDAAAMPMSLGGHARFNIANALAAAAALSASGFDPAQIAAGLATFVSDNKTNPLRANVFKLGGATLIVDYAHNPAAYKALGQAARGMARGRLIGVITAPGDRRDADLREVGQVCAAHFDDLTVYESSLRGRAPGEPGRLIMAGAQAAGTACRLQQIDDVRTALRLAISACAPGDVLVFSCASALADVVEAVRSELPPAAAEMAADLALAAETA
ncbi:cyanophycin synthetase [Oxalobacteraceae bacterium A2-2]